MTTESFELSRFFSVPAERLYSAWLDPQAHSAFTGGAATASGEVGAAFTAWGDYIQGKNLELEPGRRILQTWRTTEFPSGAEDSRLELLLEPTEGGTRLLLRHSNLPEGQAEQYRQGWKDHYFHPLEVYFAESAAPTASARPLRKKPAAIQAKRKSAAGRAKAKPKPRAPKKGRSQSKAARAKPAARKARPKKPVSKKATARAPKKVKTGRR